MAFWAHFPIFQLTSPIFWGDAKTNYFSDAAFLLTVGSFFLLTVELFAHS